MMSGPVGPTNVPWSPASIAALLVASAGPPLLLPLSLQHGNRGAPN